MSHRVLVPVRLDSPNRTKGQRHGRAREVEMIRKAVWAYLRKLGVPRTVHAELGPLPLIEITRIGPRDLDAHDNLPGACKPVVDELAAWLELKSDAALGPKYFQRRCDTALREPRFGVEIVLRRRDA